MADYLPVAVVPGQVADPGGHQIKDSAIFWNERLIQSGGGSDESFISVLYQPWKCCTVIPSVTCSSVRPPRSDSLQCLHSPSLTAWKPVLD